MPPKIAVINDLSGLGRCSLTAAISVIAAMGASPCALPTSVLSAQTGYPHYHLDDYTSRMENFRSDWQLLGQSFDGIYTGFVSSEAQIIQIFRFLETFRKPKTFLLVDPVMGDNGETFPVFSHSLRREIKKLALCADLITPNLTELCLLTGASYHDICRLPSEARISAIRREAETLLKKGVRDIVVTGIHMDACKTPPPQIGNLYLKENHCELFLTPRIGGSYSGTGDLFASCLCGALARGDSIPSAIRMAGDFLCEALRDTVHAQTDRNDGVFYERHLGRLMPTHTPPISD